MGEDSGLAGRATCTAQGLGTGVSGAASQGWVRRVALPAAPPAHAQQHSVLCQTPQSARDSRRQLRGGGGGYDASSHTQPGHRRTFAIAHHPYHASGGGGGKAHDRGCGGTSDACRARAVAALVGMAGRGYGGRPALMHCMQPWLSRSWLGRSWLGRSWLSRSWLGRSWLGRRWLGYCCFVLLGAAGLQLAIPQTAAAACQLLERAAAISLAPVAMPWELLGGSLPPHRRLQPLPAGCPAPGGSSEVPPGTASCAVTCLAGCTQ